MGIKKGTLENAPTLNEQSTVARAEKRETTRSKIALYYVIGFLFLMLCILIFAFMKSLNVDNMRDLLLAYSGVLSGPLGFIIGYYFKSHSDKE